MNHFKMPAFLHQYSVSSALGAMLLVAASTAAHAELNINLSGGNFQPMPIAITDCINEDRRRLSPA